MLAAPEIPTFTIVTPSFNTGDFINTTINSVLSQGGKFRLRYHVQDGGSTDDTVRDLELWSERIRSGLFPTQCYGLDFSYAVAPDRGMYDAIRAGFAHCGSSPAGYMSWINADDIIMPGALACVARLFRKFPDVHLMGGIPCQIDEDGAITRIHDAQIYPQSTLAAGLHDGRHLSFVMQEGTFWKAGLWLKTGGVRPDFRLAGDFDLWRRFAAETAYVSVDTILGGHRRHSGQLTADHSAYFAEVDRSLESLADERDREWERYQRWRERSAADREESFLGSRLSWETGRWELTQRALPSLFNTTIHVSPDKARRSISPQFVAGFSAETGPCPHLSLPAGSRSLHESVGILRFEAPAGGLHRLRIRLHSFSDKVAMTIKHGSRRLFEGTLPVTLHDRDIEISADVEFELGANTIAIFLDPPQAEQRSEFLIVTCEATPV
jgi:hypothetical protein